MSGIAGPTNPAWHEGQFGTQTGSPLNEGHQEELREKQERINQLWKCNDRCVSYSRTLSFVPYMQAPQTRSVKVVLGN